MPPQFVKKKVDSRVRTLIENSVQTNHRSFFVVVGDRGRDQVMYLHYMLSKARVAHKPSVLWCYKKELGFSNHSKKRMKQHQHSLQKGLHNADSENPFELFVAGTDIRYCYYKETQKILGNTYGMCVLQDFEALTPNLLARTVETVQGGGIVVLLLRTMSSLKQLYTMSMDVHSRYRTAAHGDVTCRFNERFILSLTDNEGCLVVDDELNILPLSRGKSVKPLPLLMDDERLSDSQRELKELKESLKGTEPACALVNCARTLDQARAVMTFIEGISEKSLSSTVTLTAARGRGKSAALGIAMAAAVAYGYSNIFVTSPSPENLKTLFEFVLKTFDALGYQEHLDYDIAQSTNPDFNKCIVRLNIFKNHRQTIQYIQPQDSHVLGQAELVVIDEAAAIPLPLVKKLIGPYLVFMASTINGYEGTGRSLSLKLIQQLREQSRGLSKVVDAVGDAVTSTAGTATGGRGLREIKLDEPIRYSPNDPAEKWLNKFLCLDATVQSTMRTGCPHPKDCNLYNVNRDTLFSYHPVSEAFLQRMMALYVSSHYKNSPNDLQLMSDAPAHELFVLLPPVNEEDSELPEPLAVVQVCLEGQISREAVLASLQRGKRADGDLIPWTVSQQYQDDDFASLSGARVVRIATHPDYVRMGYGSRALQLLVEYYEGKIQSLDESEVADFDMKRVTDEDLEDDQLHEEEVTVRDAAKMPPLLLSLEEKKPPYLHWIGVSYGLTPDLLRFWKKSGFGPVYLRQTANDLTGEHTCIMLKALETPVLRYDPNWLTSFLFDFRKRFLNLLGFQFRKFSSKLALSILDFSQKLDTANAFESNPVTPGEINQLFSPYDIKRMNSYANNMLDYHVITDMLPTVCRLIFTDRLIAQEDGTIKSASLSAIQKAILLGMGLQYKTIEAVSTDLNLPVSQVLALFARVMRKTSEYVQALKSKQAEACIDSARTLPTATADDGKENEGKKDADNDEEWDPTIETMAHELDEASKARMLELKKKQEEIIDSFDLTEYAIAGNEEEWSKALKDGKVKGSLMSISNPHSTKGKRKAKISVEELAAEGQKMIEKARSSSKNKKKAKKSH